METQAIEALLASQRQAFDQDMNPSLGVRLDRLDRLGRLIKDYGDRFCTAISEDFGNRSPHETTLLELAPLTGELRHARAHLRKWMRPERRARSLEFLQLSNWVQYQPLGVVGIMVPWNYPLILALGPLIDVLAAGNRAMIKPSELLPKTSRLLTEAVSAHFMPEEVSVVEGGVDVAAAFSALPFDHLIFTGSTAVGRKVMAAAAANLTPLTLELGGKSPTILAPDYSIKDAAKDIAFGKMMNAGQTCIAPDYVFVERNRLEEFGDAMVAQIETFYPASTAPQQYSTLVGQRSYDRLTAGLAEAKERGATIVTAKVAQGGQGLFIPPTLVIDPPRDCHLMEEEIFGPILPVLPYDTLDEALAFIRSRPRPLALYLFTHDAETEKKTLALTISGNVTVNGTLLHIAQNDLPFGGVGPSGMGAYHGFDGFKRFSHARGIAKVRWFNPSVLAMPPYGKIAGWLARFMSR